MINISFPGISASSFSRSGVTTADSAARADWIGCEPNARTSAVPRMRKVDIATSLRFILRKRDPMFACLLQLTSEVRSIVRAKLRNGPIEPRATNHYDLQVMTPEFYPPRIAP